MKTRKSILFELADYDVKCFKIYTLRCRKLNGTWVNNMNFLRKSEAEKAAEDYCENMTQYDIVSVTEDLVFV